MDSGILNILNEFAEKGIKYKDGYPLVLLNDSKEKYTILSDNVTDFWIEYCSLLDESRDNSGYLCEFGRDICPVIVDFTFRFPPSMEEKPQTEYYEQYLIFFIIHTIQSVLHDKLELVSRDSRELVACHLESETERVIGDEDQVYGILNLRFQFPFCHVMRKTQRKVLYPEILRRLGRKTFTDVFLDNPEGNWSDALNSKVLTKPIPFYGCVTPQDGSEHPLELVEVWSTISKEKLQAY
jgi:hypothetical protein